MEQQRVVWSIVDPDAVCMYAQQVSVEWSEYKRAARSRVAADQRGNIRTDQVSVWSRQGMCGEPEIAWYMRSCLLSPDG